MPHIPHRQGFEAGIRLDAGPARVARQLHLLHPLEAFIHGRFMGVDVQPGGADVPVVQRVRQRGLVDQVPARDVDHAAAPRQQRERAGGDDRGAGRGGQHQAVDVREHGVQGGEVDGANFALEGAGFADDVIVQDGHAEGAGPLGDHEADVAETHDAEAVVARVVRDEGDGDVGFVEGGGG